MIAVLIAALALATPAQAATVETKASCDRYRCQWRAVYTAAPGERNDVTVTYPASGVAHIHDPGATIAGCAAIDPNTVRCTGSPGEEMRAQLILGDQDDRATSTRGEIDGGAGSDTLTGEWGTITGGPGRDVLTAGPGGVTFADGDGATPEPDRYVGSASDKDAVDYAGRRDDLRIDLQAGRAAEDSLTAVEGVTGGSGDDTLSGDQDANTLLGGRGADRIAGRGGNDELTTGLDLGAVELNKRGRDVLDGGAGEDVLNVTSRPANGNVLDGGPGLDVVNASQRRDLLQGVELVSPGGAIEETLLRERLPRPSAQFLSGTDRVAARANGREVARGDRRLRLNALGQALLTERGRLAIDVVTHRGAGFRTVLRLTRARTAQASRIEGTDLADFLAGTPGEDQVLAKGGNDVIFGLGDADRIDGGPGSDSLHGDGVCRPNAVRPDECTDEDDRTGGEDVLRGGDGDDVLLGGRGNDTLDGGAGIDSLSADAGNDTIDAGDGDDEIDAGTGLDRIDAGNGDDWIGTGAGSDRITTGAGSDLIATESGNDRIDAGSEDDEIKSGGGRDRIDGGDGDDQIEAGSGNDTIDGGDGRDRIAAGSGNDTLDVRDGDRDVVDCGSGRDSVRADSEDRIRGCERVNGRSRR